MMSVVEYAKDVNKKVEEILSTCKKLGINAVTADDLLSEEAIVMLDNNIEDTTEEINEELEEEYEEKPKKNKKNKQNTIKNKVDFAKKKKTVYKNKTKLQSNDTALENIVIYKENMTIGQLAKELNVNGSEIIKKLFNLGVMATINNCISYENAEILVLDYNKELKKEAATNIANFEEFEIIDNKNDLVTRPPVVTIMGHVDHGKTTLLDAIRKTDVVSSEAGGITQAISAYQVNYKKDIITFIDTPGHAAFTEMRARGASITDIVIIIVAADDGVMPQTEEAIDHAKAAGVPIIVAINKIDRPNANPDKVMQELSEYGLMPEEWGGDILYNKISAKTGEGIDKLLENILLIADMQEYKANPNKYASGTVIEAKLDKHVGSIVTLLIQNGTLRLGDPIVVGTNFGKVRTLKNDKGEQVIKALPSQPVEITGLNDVPMAGDKFMSFETDKQARSIGEERKMKFQLKENKKESISLDDLFNKIKEGQKEINVIIKADVHGSSEAVKTSLQKLEVESVKINIIRSSVGGITESDIVLAKASNAVIIGFNIRPSNLIKDKAKVENVDIRLYDIIYKVVEEMESAMKGMLDPKYEEKTLGTAEVKKLFKYSKVGTIAGTLVTSGTIKRDSKTRVIRDDIIIYDGIISSLQREKDSVKEVKKGLECGITIENYNDIKVGDIIESYEMVEIKN